MATKTKKNPDVGRSTAFAEPQAPTAKTAVAATALVPDLKTVRKTQGVGRQYLYWVGVTPSCPVASVDLAGINFPKINEQLIPNPAQPGRKMRRAVVGAIVRLDEQRFRRMVERLPRTVIRFRDGLPEDDAGASGARIDDAAKTVRKGKLITIPTAEEIAQRRAAGKPTREYIPHENDEPAAHYMFAVLCADQDRGTRGDVYPPTLGDVGLEWPDDLDEDDNDLME